MSIKKILVAEDNENNRLLIEDIFRKKKDLYALQFVEDGAVLLNEAESTQPDLILLDMGLPTLSGWDAAIQLKANPNTSQIPIIAVTAHAMKGDDERAKKVGCDGFVTKPVSKQLLLDTVAQWIHKGE